jgi:chromosome segregation ATPase
MKDYYPGKGCQCYAHSEYECACPDVDWTETEVYELREQLEALKLERDALWVKTQEDEREINDLRDVNTSLRNKIKALEEVVAKYTSIPKAVISKLREFPDIVQSEITSVPKEEA